MARIDDITLTSGINSLAIYAVASGLYNRASDITFTAHPSNSGVLYIRKTTTVGFGYPLNPAGTLSIAGPIDLNDYTASCVSGQRLAWLAQQ